MNNESSREIQMVIAFHTDVRFRRIIYQDARNWTTKLSRNLNGHNFSPRGLIQSDNISRRIKLNNESSREIQMVITFHSEVRFRRIIYETHKIQQRKLSRNSNVHNFSLGGSIQVHNISGRSKLNNGSSREIQMVMTFNSEVRFRRIIHRDDLNWTMEALEQFKWS